jgi:DNA processing protein
MLNDAELRAWLRLSETPRVTRAGARALLAQFGGAEEVFAVSLARWRAVAPGVAAALSELPPAFDELMRRAQTWLSGPGPRRVIPLGDPLYPAALLNTPDPPLLLWAMGALERLELPMLAVVGSRQASAQGLDNARQFSAELARQGLAIVSGLALGIDAAAHEGALSAGGSTIAVVGNGLDTVYPRSHTALAARIQAGGVLLSEFAPGTPALREHFPSRNRIIAGLSRGCLVVEAAPQSGSLITARQAADYGREVMAIPGSIHSPQSRGCHQLIQQGAKLVQSAQDVLDELGFGAARTGGAPRQHAPSAVAPAGDELLQALGHDPATLDELVARSGWSVARLQARLLELELAGEVAALPGARFQRRGRA